MGKGTGLRLEVVYPHVLRESERVVVPGHLTMLQLLTNQWHPRIPVYAVRRSLLIFQQRTGCSVSRAQDGSTKHVAMALTCVSRVPIRPDRHYNT